ncbi:golgin subfamily A member 4-like isoform X1 [Polistes fuscatus]|uniref:golgin subfamily A member 4-like isoform X1 n=2 Tax=Polistes fuscatus TaxID=30207 RepID=UPI001CA95A64|nr:golgin subfamily A member 4-like isoform X1 [Polistes fuscatus]
MKFFVVLLFMQFIMWGEFEEPPGTVEEGPPEKLLEAKKTCKQNKNQLESLKEIMLKNKQSLKKKEEEVQEYASRLSKIKSRTKLSKRSKEGASTSKDVEQPSEIDTSIKDISQATTPKAKSSLLQRMLVENRKVFEQRNKEMTETKRAVEEKVEAIRQQLDEKDLAMMELQKDQTVTPVIVTSEMVIPVPESTYIQEKDNKIIELNNKVSELQAIIMDLQENLKEKDSVIDSKTKAITLMSADLSKKGKTTLDTLEDTKGEMRTMQEHFVLLESSLKQKNDNLLQQLHERDDKISELDDTIKRYENELAEQKLSEIANSDLSRSTLDTLADTKSAMTSMQENFILIESSLKMKNDNLLQQLQDYEIKLAEANEKIFQLESGKGIVKAPSIEDLQYNLNKLKENNRQLQDEKYELQKSIADMQNKIIASKSMHGNGAIMEKDNRIAELENLVEELKKSNDLLEEESKTELQKQLAELSVKNEDYSNRIMELEKLVHNLEIEKNEIASQLPSELSIQKENEKTQKLIKELDDLNKNMIKIKAQHKSKVKALQKQLENFKMVSDTNAELVRLGNQVALLEEEKGNLQLSLVDFDELKASAGDWQERIAELESRVSMQTDEIQKNIDAIAILENQKLDLIQELHLIKQKVSELEAEVADAENHRVTAEMKVVDLEEQLESVHKITENKLEMSPNVNELLQKIETLQQENTELSSKLTKLEEKSTSDAGSTESFETIHEVDKNELLKKIEDLTQRNDELTLKLTKLEERNSSHAGSTESFEAINDVDKNELLKKIDQLTQENNDLIVKLSRNDEKGSSDTGSTESFERIPEHNESTAKIELLTQENNDLVIKMTKLEEKLLHLENSYSEIVESNDILQIRKNELDLQNESLLYVNNNLSTELTKLKSQISDMEEENTNFQKRIEVLTTENNDLVIKYTKLEERLSVIQEKQSNSTERTVRSIDNEDQMNALLLEKNNLEKELKIVVEKLIERTNNASFFEIEINDTKLKMNKLLEEKQDIIMKMQQLEEINQQLMDDLNRTTQEKEELSNQIEFINQKERKTKEGQEISAGLQESIEEPDNSQQTNVSAILQDESAIIASLEKEIKHCKELITEQTNVIEEMKLKLSSQEEELEEKTKQILNYEASEKERETLENELKEMSETIEEWKFKYENLEEKMNSLEVSKVSIENGFSMLQEENKRLIEEIERKEMAKNILKEELESRIATLESNLEKERTIISKKEDEINSLKESLESKNQDLQNKYLQNEMMAIDNFQYELKNYKIDIQQKDLRIVSLSQELERVNDVLRSTEDEIYSLEKKHSELQEKLRESVPRTEYNKLLEELRDNEILVNNMQSKIDERMKEKNELLVQLESMSQQNQEVRYQLIQKHEELQNVLMIKEELDAQIIETEKTKADAEKRIMDIESSLENNAKFIDELQSELKGAYIMMEQLKVKHLEDIEMHNRRLEDTIEELNTKIQECESLKTELLEKEKLISQNLLEETKITLETKVADLEQKLVDSENKKQAQLEKMKKIVATLKRKTAMCQEFEARIAELEEKWTSEKDEKEAKNKKNQEVESSMREKDNKIADLEEKLSKAKSETADSLEHVERLTNESAVLKDKMFLLINQISELEDELHRRIAQHSTDMEAEKLAKQSVIKECESSKKEILQKYDQQQLILEETKENARELSVRMQVMETEYVEHLGLIKHLQAENCLLSSKQIQINEKLENVEKESEDRRLLIEELQKKMAVSTEDQITQTSEDELRHDTRSIVQQCDHCEQCQTIVQALEAKLQEREAEIENLDNELANSIGNFVQMRESLRFNDMMNQSTIRNRTMEDPYNDLLYQYNTLLANNEEIKIKLENMVKENEEIVEKSKTHEALNASLQDKILAMEKTLMEDEKYNDLLKKYSERESELQNLLEKLEAMENEMKRSVEMLQGEITVLKSEKEELLEKCKLLSDQKEALEQELEHLKIENNEHNQRLIELQSELDKLNQKNITPIEETVNVSLTKSSDLDIVYEEKYTSPQLFDASKIFGPQYDIDEQKETAKLQDLVNNKDIECLALKKEIDSLQKQMNEDKAQMLLSRNAYEEELKISQERCQTMQIEINNLQLVIDDKVKQIGLLNDEMNNVHNQQESVNTQIEELKKTKDSEIQSLQVELNTTKDIITSLSMQCDEQNNFIEMYKLQISNLEQEIRNTMNNDSTLDLQQQLMEITKEKDMLQLQMNDLTRSLQELKQQNIILQSVKEEESTRSAIQNLEVTPKDENKLQKAASGSSELTGIQTTSVMEQSTNLSVDDANDKFNTDEDTWGWNADDVQTTDDHHDTHSPISIIPSVEIQLRTKIDEMEKKLLDLEEEKVKLIEENKTLQIRSGKMVKKLKEYKVQVENLQQQLKSQKSMTGLCELDSAIEEELRLQITELEKNLKESSAEHKHLLVEKENLLKRINVLELANETYIDMKEKQDMNMEVLRLENKDLMNKIKSLEGRFSEENITPESELEFAMSAKQLQKRATEDVTPDIKQLCDKHKEELEALKDDMEALATENEQLQNYLEEQKSRISTLEEKLIAGKKDSQELREVQERKDELQGLLEKLEKENEVLKKQFEERLGDISKETLQMEEQIKELNQQLELSKTRANELQKREENSLEEKSKMEEKINKAKITEEKLSAVSESLTEVTELLNARVQEVADLKQELQKQYVARQEAEEKLQNNIQDLTYELRERKQELDDLRGAFSVKESELIQQKSVETVSLLVSEATQELVQKHAIDIEDRNKEIRDLRDKLNALQITNDEYASELVKRSTQEETVISLSQNLNEKVMLLETIKAELLQTKEEFQQRQLQWESESRQHSLDIEKYLSTIGQLEDRLRESEYVSRKLQEQVTSLSRFEQEIVNLQATLSDKEFVLNKFEEELQRSKVLLNERDAEIKELRIKLQHFDEMKKDLHESANEFIHSTAEFETVCKNLENTEEALKETESLLKVTEEKLNEKQMELDRLSSNNSFLQNQQSSTTGDGLPLFRMGNDNEEMLHNTIENLKIQLEEKQQEIEHLKYIIEENTYPRIIQEMQVNINLLYNEKAQLENALQTAQHSLLEKQNQIESLIKHLDAQEKEDSTLLTRERDRRSIQDQEEIVKLQNELHAKEQEINELKYVIAEKDSQLSQVNLDPSSYDYELRENLQSLTAELYAKEQEIRQLKTSIDEAQNEILRLKDLERISEETRNMIERLTSEKETIRLESEELLEKKLAEKESEIDAIKQRLLMENEEFLNKLRSKDHDVENLKRQLETWSMEFDEALRRKDEELQIVNMNLQEKDKLISELTFTKEAEIRNLTIQIHEKDIRIEELIELYKKDQNELAELRQYIEEKESEIRELTDRLESKVKEYEMIQHALKKDFPIAEAMKIQEGQEMERTILNTSDILEGSENSKYSNELDLALYMLHQRDVRCEELTHELMQLLEERDTLQLRLSNAIRINEELRKISSDSSPKKDAPASLETTDEPLIEHPSPSKSDGPVEIAKEAIDAPIEEDKAALSLKLSQLHTVGHTKDVRLRDERELRHTQQMSLLAHKDVLSTLPPEAAAKLVNANYTLSRDVQSQSSVLLNWLWGKSTPKVMHM